ncbi:AAA family ATPase [Actinomadura sp. 21ATH]|uniref:AAA family ATPase n=1 Tax=Actinomadura sp. 21ATH TaxID=1735444 RepID=UPI0035C163B4
MGLILADGLPGTGKSTLAGTIADHLGCTLLGSDRVRKELAGLSPPTPVRPRTAPASTAPAGSGARTPSSSGGRGGCWSWARPWSWTPPGPPGRTAPWPPNSPAKSRPSCTRCDAGPAARASPRADFRRGFPKRPSLFTAGSKTASTAFRA